MKFDLEELLLNDWLEKESNDKSIIEISNEFETALQTIQATEHAKAHLSNIKSEYGSRCKITGFHHGYCTALEILRQLSIL